MNAVDERIQVPVPYELFQKVTFCMGVPDMSLQHLGIHQDDLLLCDGETESARLVLATWDDQTHVCQPVREGLLIDAGGDGFAPDSAVVCGRVLGIFRPMVHINENEEEAQEK